MTKLNHFNDAGDAHMVDVGDKQVTLRKAVAQGRIQMQAETLQRIVQGSHKKGDVLGVARMAGVMAAKKTADLIPLCHNIPIGKAHVEYTLGETTIEARCTVTTYAKTGVEMEALAGVTVTLLNIWDMTKYLEKDEDGQYKIPFLIVADAFQSETVAFADLVLPDTSYLERHDVMSMLDRPISEFDGPVDSVRIPILPPTGDSKPFQEVIIELGSRLKLPAFTNADGSRKFRDYPDFVINYEAAPGIGFLAGWRGKGGEKFMKGEPNPKQWEMYEKNNCVFHYELPKSYQYMRNWNQGYLEWSKRHALTRYVEPINIHIYSEVLQKFRLAAQGKYGGKQPPDHLRKRIETYFDPLPFYYEPLEGQLSDKHKYPLSAVTQRPMAMYHSWDSQNAWLRQIHAHNYLYMSPKVGAAGGFEDGDWVWVESMHGKVRCMCRFSEAVEPGTVWTWNAIGKAAGAWGLSPKANESQKGFLLNHVISEELPPCESGERMSNSDPVTGQAAWFDVRVKVYKADATEPKISFPQFKPQRLLPGQDKHRHGKWQSYFAGMFRKKTGIDS